MAPTLASKPIMPSFPRKRRSGDPESLKFKNLVIPAQAGIFNSMLYSSIDSRLRGNDSY